MANLSKFQKALYVGDFKKDHVQHIHDNIDGMCNLDTLSMINFAVTECMINDERYLEVGTWKGRTVVGALQNNNTLATVIDPLGYDDSSTVFYENINKYGLTDRIHMNQMSWQEFVPDATFRNIGVYLYDGDHGENSSYDGLCGFLPYLADESILIVDDLSMDPVKKDMDRWIRDYADNIVFYHETNYWMRQAIIGFKKT